MRLKEEIVREGEFWIPGDKENSVTGRIFIRENQKIILELNGSIRDASFFMASGGSRRLNGFIEREGLVTLDGCFYKTFNLTEGIGEKSIIHVHIAFLGYAYMDGEDVLFDSLTLRTDGLEEWVGVTGISFDYKPDKAGEYAINYSKPENIVIDLFENYKLEICFGYGFKGAGSLREARVEHRTYLKIIAPEAVSFERLNDMAHKIINLISLSFEKPLVIVQLTGLKKYDNGKDVSTSDSVSIYYQSSRYVELTSGLDAADMIFSFKDIKSNASSFFVKWLEVCEKLSPSVGLYFSSVSGQHGLIEARFISLVQGLETYHRTNFPEKKMSEDHFQSLINKLICDCPPESVEWLRGRLTHGNEISLYTRMIRLTSVMENIVGDKRFLKKLSREIVDTRNYLTHYDAQLKSRSASGRRLVQLSFMLELVFLAHFLIMIGFESENIKTFYARNFRLNQLLHFVRN